MTVNEAYPLILFTLLSGTAFGLWATVFALRFWVQGSSSEQGISIRVLGWLAVVLQIVAIATSLLHLSMPLAFYRALINWQGSWLTREVWFAGVFFGVIALYMVMYEWSRRGKGLSDSLFTILGGLGVLLGLAMAFSSGMIYVDAKAFPGWMNPAIAFLFPVTGLAVGLALGFGLWLGRQGERPGAKAFAAVMFVLVIVSTCVIWATLFAPGSVSASIPQWQLLGLALLVLVTGGVYVLMLVRPKFLAPLWVWVGFLALVACVVLSRLWFYTFAVHL